MGGFAAAAMHASRHTGTGTPIDWNDPYTIAWIGAMVGLCLYMVLIAVWPKRHAK